MNSTYWILHFEETILDFWTKFAQEGYIWLKTKSKHYHWILLIRISFSTKFQNKLTNLVFWIKFAQKRFFWSNTEKVNRTIEFCIFKFQLKLTNLSFWTKFTQNRDFRSKREKVSITMEFSIFELALVPSFSLNW